MEKVRWQDFDNIKGCLIVLVVFAHVLMPLQDRALNDAMFDAIYYVHMPAFVFVSGYFSKSAHARGWSSCMKLLFGYLFFVAFFVVIDVFAGRQPHVLWPYASEWYLMALVVWRLAASVYEHLGGKPSAWLAGSAAVALLAGCFPDIGDNATLSLHKVVGFAPYFFAGYFFTAENMQAIREQVTGRRIAVALVALAALACLELFSHGALAITDHDLLPQGYTSYDLRNPAARVAILAASACFVIALLHGAPNHRLPLLTRWGRNTLAIYLLHRPVTMVFAAWIAPLSTGVQLAAAVCLTGALCGICGADAVAGRVDRFLARCAAVVTERTLPATLANRLTRDIIVATLCVTFVVPVLAGYVRTYRAARTPDPIYRVMTAEQEARFDGAYKILFAGDLILLEDQVKRGRAGDGYDFAANFAYTKADIAAADFAIGVLETPVAGPPYAVGNFDDGKALALNAPDAWAEAVRDAGFDLVTTANNHLLDQGEGGLVRTLDTLDRLGLAHTGSYRNAEEKQASRVRLVEQGGMRMAILSYTYGVNDADDDALADGALAYATSVIVPRSSPHYAAARAAVAEDFAAAKALAPDLILVLPHWGTQFADAPDAMQQDWAQYFAEQGADIIFGDHTHSTQPVTITTRADGRQTLTLYSPGNYANSYREHDGDCSALVEAYVDRETKEIIGGAVVPLWTASTVAGNYRPIPPDAIDQTPARDEAFPSDASGRASTRAALGEHAPTLAETLTTDDLARAQAAVRHVTRTMLGTELAPDLAGHRCYFDADGFLRRRVPPIRLTDAERAHRAVQLLATAKGVCFVGDSVTEGTKNGGVPWCEPLAPFAAGGAIYRGWGGATTKTLLRDHLADIVNAPADTYVIAIGTNDVRYRDPDLCAMTPEEYTTELQKLRDAIAAAHPDARFVFVAPWLSTDGDRNAALPYAEKTAMNDAYSAALHVWTQTTGDAYVDANAAIRARLMARPQKDFLLDAIHPNASRGVALYAWAFCAYGGE